MIRKTRGTLETGTFSALALSACLSHSTPNVSEKTAQAREPSVYLEKEPLAINTALVEQYRALIHEVMTQEESIKEMNERIASLIEQGREASKENFDLSKKRDEAVFTFFDTLAALNSLPINENELRIALEEIDTEKIQSFLNGLKDDQQAYEFLKSVEQEVLPAILLCHESKCYELEVIRALLPKIISEMENELKRRHGR